jgi:hypothetical protein
MGNTRRGREVNADMGRREVLDGSREEASTVVEDQNTSPKGVLKVRVIQKVTVLVLVTVVLVIRKLIVMSLVVKNKLTTKLKKT